MAVINRTKNLRESVVCIWFQKINGTFFQTRGGSLGVGIPGALGIHLAKPEAEILAFTEDGGSMYTIQTLHTASRYNIPIKIVICNNGRYHLLDKNLEVYWNEEGITPHVPPDCFSLAPQVDFVGPARSMGVDGAKVTTAAEAENAAEKMLRADGPFLINLNTSTS